jgi:hypothetical protein
MGHYWFFSICNVHKGCSVCESKFPDFAVNDSWL